MTEVGPAIGLTAAEMEQALLDQRRSSPDITRDPQYIVEGIILRRLHEKRIEGYTIATAKEIVAALQSSSAATTTPVCCYCDASLSCACCGREQPADAAQPSSALAAKQLSDQLQEMVDMVAPTIKSEHRLSQGLSSALIRSRQLLASLSISSTMHHTPGDSK